nr:MAG TPA: hypothetical protein [Caudoviricetes sp.]
MGRHPSETHSCLLIHARGKNIGGGYPGEGHKEKCHPNTLMRRLYT